VLEAIVLDHQAVHEEIDRFPHCFVTVGEVQGLVDRRWIEI
jgi:hypothetical protein